MSIRIRDHAGGVGVGLLQNLFLLVFRLVKQSSGSTAHLRIQTGDAGLSRLEFRQLLHSDGQLLLQFGILPIEGIYRVGQKVYVFLHLGGGVTAYGAAEGVIADFLRQ